MSVLFLLWAFCSSCMIFSIFAFVLMFIWLSVCHFLVESNGNFATKKEEASPFAARCVFLLPLGFHCQRSHCVQRVQLMQRVAGEKWRLTYGKTEWEGLSPIITPFHFVNTTIADPFHKDIKANWYSAGTWILLVCLFVGMITQKVLLKLGERVVDMDQEESVIFWCWSESRGQYRNAF